MRRLPRYAFVVACLALFFAAVAVGLVVALLHALHGGATPALALPALLVALASVAACVWSLWIFRRAWRGDVTGTHVGRSGGRYRNG